MMDWSKLPDLGAVGLLTTAFATVARRSQTPVSGLWLTGWVMIAIHFAALVFAPAPGFAGTLAVFIALSSLAWAGVLFMWASVPHHKEASSRRMLIALLGTSTLYIGMLALAPGAPWLLPVPAILIGAVPLTVAIISARKFTHPLRYIVVVLYAGLAIFLLAFQNRPGNGLDIALNSVFFTVFLGCSLNFFLAYQRLGSGVLVTTAGFLAWASVFVIAPSIQTILPGGVHIESEVWNLPKYVVAVGMILVILEQQIEHNKHLALHDELTGLPNRRLFQDRISSAIERARRTGARTALLLIDLDRFKQVNDTAGHHAGDEVLKRVAQILEGRVRRTDTVARTGGDEFSIILEEPITRDDAERVSNSLIDLLHQSLALDGHTIRIGASIGLALYPEDAPNAETLRIAADLSMYAQKNTTHQKETQEPQITHYSRQATATETRNPA